MNKEKNKDKTGKAKATQLLLAVIVIFISLFLPYIVSQAVAQEYKGYDTSLPVEITANQLDILQKDKLAVFSGNVVAQQGTVKLRAETMTVHYRPAKDNEAGAAAVSRIEVDGKVFMATPQESAQAQKGVYDVDNKMIYLLGNVVLTRGKNVLKGSKLQYNLATGRSLITGGGDKSGNAGGGNKGNGDDGRVRGIFVPMKK